MQRLPGIYVSDLLEFTHEIFRAFGRRCCDASSRSAGVDGRFEKAAQYFEQSGNRFHAGQTRFNMALTYLSSTLRESTSSGKETLLRRAQTYAAAALRDFQHYEGRAADEETRCQQLIDDIQQQLS